MPDQTKVVFFCPTDKSRTEGGKERRKKGEREGGRNRLWTQLSIVVIVSWQE